ILSNQIKKTCFLNYFIVKDYKTNKQYLNFKYIRHLDADVGDKFATRYAQKGVISSIHERYDMPVLENGLVPTVLINPASFPSRMTVGHLYEMLYDKRKYIDATPYEKLDKIDTKKNYSRIMFPRCGIFTLNKIFHG